MDRNYVIFALFMFGIFAAGMAYEDHTKVECRIAAINAHMDAAAVKDLCK